MPLKTAIDPAGIESALAVLHPLADFTEAERAALATSGEILEVKRGKYLFREGDSDPYSYFLLAGEIELSARKEIISKLRGGEPKAQHALAQLQPRQMSARARSAITAFRCERALIEEMTKRALDAADGLEVEEVTEGEDWIARLLQSEIFARVPAANMQRIFTALMPVRFSAGDEVISQGDKGDYYYIVQSGRCEVIRRASETAKPVQLAVLEAGDSFGEEALLADAPRNATVRMLSDGELMRLDKSQFLELIGVPMVEYTDAEGADREIGKGAMMLDVRFGPEAGGEGLNIPLNLLRVKAKSLDRSKRYIVRCDSGRQAAVGSFLLAERGFDVLCLSEGGAPLAQPANSGPMPSAKSDPAGAQVLDFAAAGSARAEARIEAEVPAEPDPAKTQEQAELEVAAHMAIESEVKSQALRAELSQANAELDKALQAREAAERERASAERENERKLRETAEQAEREALRLKSEMEQARAEAAAEAEAIRLEAEQAAKRLYEEERARLAQEGAKAQAALEEAARLKAELKRAQLQAQADAQRRREEEQARIDALREQTESRLAQEKEKLEQAYRWRNEEVAKLKDLRRQAQAQIQAERAKLNAESEVAQERLQEARRVEQEVEQTRRAAAEEAERRQRRQVELEERLRAELDTKIDTERRKLEIEMARNAEQLALAQREREAAEAAREAAANEAEKIIAEYQENFEQTRAQEQAKLDAEKQRLQMQAQELQRSMEEAQQARSEAEKARNRALAALAESQASGAEQVALQEKARAAEAELSQARAELEAAEAAQAVNEVEQQTNRDSSSALSEELQAELNEWMREQEELENSQAQAALLANQREHMERIRQRALLARENAKKHNSTLIEELQSKLGRPEDDL